MIDSKTGEFIGFVYDPGKGFNPDPNQPMTKAQGVALLNLIDGLLNMMEFDFPFLKLHGYIEYFKELSSNLRKELKE